MAELPTPQSAYRTDLSLPGMTSTSKMSIRFLVHETPSKIPCDICRRMYARRSNLIKHVRRAHDNAPKKCVCGICGKAFFDNWSLRNHKSNVHVGGRGYNCHYCAPTSFSTAGHLKKHMRSQHGHGAQG